MKLKEVIKKQTLLIVLTVAVVAITTVGVSYAVFFDVKKNSQDQVITAGTLKVTLQKNGDIEWNETKSDEEGKASTPLTYTVKNTDSTLPADYAVYVYADESVNTIPLGYVKFSTDGVESKYLTNAAQVDPNLTKETIGGVERTLYRIEVGKIAAGADVNKTLRMWISDQDESGAELSDGEFTVKLNLYIVSFVDEDAAATQS